jgi:hypothetical protein
LPTSESSASLLASFADLAADLVTANAWQEELRDITPGGGSYMSEVTYNFPYWKEDYSGVYYDQLVGVKNKYDPGHVLWSQPRAGDDAYELKEDGHLSPPCTEPPVAFSVQPLIPSTGNSEHMNRIFYFALLR